MPGQRVLYISYDGLTDPLGRSQVLPYLTGLAALGHEITILSCEKPARLESDGAQIRQICAEAGLDWQPLIYHARPPVLSTVWDVMRLCRAAERLHRARGFRIVHCRSYIPAIAGRLLQKRHGVRFLFDMRGFWPEEKTEGGSWPQSNPVFRAVYLYFKRREADFLAYADHVVSLTQAGADELTARPGGTAPDRVTIIPCCVDFGHFSGLTPDAKLAQRRALGLPADASVLVYVGSLGGNYMLDELLDFFRAYRRARPGARFLFVTREEPGHILAAAAERGVDASEIVVRAASREEVPLFTAAADVGIAFKQPVFSSKGCSPTKLGEMLALGLPVIANDGVGDVAPILEETGAGVVLTRFDEAGYQAAIDAAARLPLTAEQIRNKALPWFDVEIGIARYDAVYRSLA